MPLKELFSQADRNGLQKTFKFGGGANTVFAEDDAITARAFGYIINGSGGNDTIFGSDSLFDDLLIGGDGSDVIVGGLGNDTIHGGNESDGSDKAKGKSGLPTNTLYGDGGFDASDPDNIVLIDLLKVSGAPDAVTGVSAPSYGDTITGGDGSTNDIYGDYVTVTLTGNATADDAPVYIGGSDTLDGGDNDDALLVVSVDGNDLPQNNIYGDAEYLTLGENTEYTGGVDHITGGTNADNSLYGDVGFLTFLGSANSASFTGGDDVITGGDAFGTGLPVNDIYGDAVRVTFSNANGESFTGGDDTIYGGDLTVDSPSPAGFTSVIYGDVSQIFGINSGSFQGGDDTIYSGAYANDKIYGDWGTDGPGGALGGEDTFVFGLNNGDDLIKDLRITDDNIDTVRVGDKIDLIAFEFLRDFTASLYTDANDLLTDLIVENGDGDAVIDFSRDKDGLSGSGTITVEDWSAVNLELAIADVFILELVVA